MHESGDFLVGLFCGSVLKCSKMHTSLASLFGRSLSSGSKMQTSFVGLCCGSFWTCIGLFCRSFRHASISLAGRLLTCICQP